MAEQFYTILTQIGKAKIANANVIGNKINFVKLKVGDGGGAFYNPTETQTDLKNKVWEGNINSIYVDEKNLNWIVIETIIPGDVGGFTIRETGIFDDENNLIAVSNYPETYKPIASEGSSKDVVIKIILEVSNSNTVTLKIDPTVMIASKADIQILQSSMTDLTNKFNLHVTDNMRHNSYVVATNIGNKYSVTVSNLAVLSDGYPLAVKFNEASTGSITLNPNKLGDIKVIDYFGNQVTNVRKNLIANLRYEAISNSFILLGKGGGGNATTDQLLNGVTATVDSGPIIGTMQNNGAMIITPKTYNQSINKGYHNGNGYVIGEPNLTPDKIVYPFSVFGVQGTATIENLGGCRFDSGELKQLGSPVTVLPANTLKYLPGKLLIEYYVDVTHIIGRKLCAGNILYDFNNNIAIGLIEGSTSVSGTGDSGTTVNLYEPINIYNFSISQNNTLASPLMYLVVNNTETVFANHAEVNALNDYNRNKTEANYWQKTSYYTTKWIAFM